MEKKNTRCFMPLLLAQLFLISVSASGAKKPGAAIKADSKKHEIQVSVGPLSLPAQSTHGSHGGHGGHASHAGVPQPPALTVEIPVDGWIQGFNFDVVDGTGQQVPREVIHHVNLMLPDRRELFSPMMQRLAAAGFDTPDVRLPRIVGVPVKRGEKLLVKTMLHNPTGRSFKNATLRLNLVYLPADAFPPAKSVQPFYVDVMPPVGEHAYDMPPGRSEKSWEGKPAVGGEILGVGGHLHDYAVGIRFEDVTAKKVLWEAKPEYDELGRTSKTPNRIFPTGIRIEPDHTYRLTAVYDNPTGETIKDGAMGALGGIFSPEQGNWPPVDRRNPQYRADLKLQMGPMAPMG